MGDVWGETSHGVSHGFEDTGNDNIGVDDQPVEISVKANQPCE